MKPLLAVFAGLAACLPALAVAQEHESVLTVQVLADGAPMAERRVGRIQPFYRQDLLRQGGIIFHLSPSALDAFRNRHNLHDHVPFELTEWLARDAGAGAAPRHLGYLHCSSRVRLGTGEIKTCLRDSDSDGLLDAVTSFQTYPFPREGLRFEPIEPIAYRYQQRARTPLARSMYVQPGIGIAYDLDRATGRLQFRAQVLAAGVRGDIEPSVVVDPAQLPTTIDIAGARVTVLAWDGRRATVRVDRPLTDRPVRLISTERGLFRAPPRGASEGWRLEISNIPLPGSPPQPPVPETAE